MHHRYILCVLPDLTARPIRIRNDYIIDLGNFLRRQELYSDDYRLYYVSPSWIQVLPDSGLWAVPEELEKKVPEYRLQFFPKKTPPNILRIYTRSNENVKLANWNLLIEQESEASLNSIISIFNNCFCVNASDFAFKFEPERRIIENNFSSSENEEVIIDFNESNQISKRISIESIPQLGDSSIYHETANYNEHNASDIKINQKNDISEKAVYLDLPLMDQTKVFMNTKIILEVKMTPQNASKARQRNEIIKEIISTERNYVNDLKLVQEKITKELFKEFRLSEDIHKRIFKTVAEIIPSHQTFLQELEKVGTSPETSIGHFFRHHLSIFRMSSPHIAHYRTANEELIELLNSNHAFAGRIAQISRQYFDDMPLENLFIKPIQRIPQYPIFLKRIIKATPTNHWDYYHCEKAIEGINKLLNDLDSHRKIQNELDIMAELQKKFGSHFQIIKTSRKLLFEVEGILICQNETPNNCKNGEKAKNLIYNSVKKANKYDFKPEIKSNLYLFNDILLLVQNRTFIEIDILKCQNEMRNGNEILINKKLSVRFQDDPSKILEFKELLHQTKRDQIMKMRTFGQAILWTSSNDRERYSPPHLIASALASVGNKIYLFGGIKPDGQYSNDLWVYTTSGWVLQEVDNAPAPRAFHTMISFRQGTNCNLSDMSNVVIDASSLESVNSVLDTSCITDSVNVNSVSSSNDFNDMDNLHVRCSKLVVFGGRNSEGYLNDLLVFDIGTCSWSKIDAENPPSQRIGHCSAFLGSQLFLFGGIDSHNDYLNDFYAFDFDTNEWYDMNANIECDIPMARAFASSFLVNRDYFGVFGGGTANNQFLNDLWIFNFEDNKWIYQQFEGKVITPRQAASAGVIDNVLYVVGGNTKSIIFDSKSQIDISQFLLLNNCSNDSNLDQFESYSLNLNNIIEDRLVEWKKIPQCDEPEHFSFGGCTVVNRFGLVLFSTTLYKIKLYFAKHSKRISRKTSLSSRHYNISMSSPIYNSKLNTVTTTIDNIAAKNDFSAEFLEQSLQEVVKISQKELFWRLTAVLEEDGSSTLCDSCNKFVLTEDQFCEIPKLVQRNQDEIPFLSGIICYDNDLKIVSTKESKWFCKTRRNSHPTSLLNNNEKTKKSKPHLWLKSRSKKKIVEEQDLNNFPPERRSSKCHIHIRKNSHPKIPLPLFEKKRIKDTIHIETTDEFNSGSNVIIEQEKSKEPIKERRNDKKKEEKERRKEEKERRKVEKEKEKERKAEKKAEKLLKLNDIFGKKKDKKRSKLKPFKKTSHSVCSEEESTLHRSHLAYYDKEFDDDIIQPVKTIRSLPRYKTTENQKYPRNNKNANLCKTVSDDSECISGNSSDLLSFSSFSNRESSDMDGKPDLQVENKLNDDMFSLIPVPEYPLDLSEKRLSNQIRPMDDLLVFDTYDSRIGSQPSVRHIYSNV
ncbi:hypothetical protein TRFO_24681 [Tritrichomonas foetus]|uniref:DH domain-containing protein n=1 Tax=Tritrichomonas foetus TaxID=1144522 RepID=A0A1J4K8Q0_9EUKA|nr:hypothetical protein TRFO_24681 [Tritrichomonas foetus]|eukprot:OHT07264.1 hypothetical protein TRFO_24681 [Tritrichomonas foetus]